MDEVHNVELDSDPKYGVYFTSRFSEDSLSNL